MMKKKYLYITLPLLLLLAVAIILAMPRTELPTDATPHEQALLDTLPTTSPEQVLDTLLLPWEWLSKSECPQWDNEYADTLVSPTVESLENWKYSLADTLSRLSEAYLFPRTEWEEVHLVGGGIRLTFQLEPAPVKPEYGCAVLPVVIRRPLGEGIRFESDWEVEVDLSSSSIGGLSSTWNTVRVHGDSILTHLQAGLSWVTPEGKTFRLAGNAIERIEARTRAVYAISENIYWMTQDSWTIPIGYLASAWTDCAVSRNSYRLPVMGKIRVDEPLFRRLKHAAVAIQRRMLVDRRDSVIASQETPENRQWAAGVLDEWRARLNSDFESAATFRELSVHFELLYFQTEITAHLRDGSIRRFVHFADYECDIP